MLNKTKLLEGGWMEFLSSVREASQKELTDDQVKAMMKLYITGTSVEDALRKILEEGIDG